MCSEPQNAKTLWHESLEPMFSEPQNAKTLLHESLEPMFSEPRNANTLWHESLEPGFKGWDGSMSLVGGPNLGTSVGPEHNQRFPASRAPTPRPGMNQQGSSNKQTEQNYAMASQLHPLRMTRPRLILPFGGGGGGRAWPQSAKSWRSAQAKQNSPGLWGPHSDSDTYLQNYFSPFSPNGPLALAFPAFQARASRTATCRPCRHL